jgi:signal transduction histidine kinase
LLLVLLFPKRKSDSLSGGSSGGGRLKEIGIISIILIIVVSYGIFFYLENSNEANVRTILFNDQKQRQIDSTRFVSQHISSDLNLVLADLRGLASSANIQQGELSTSSTRNLVEGVYLQINSIVDRLFLVDKNNIVVLNIIIPKGQKTFVGSNVSHFNWISETKAEKKPIFSNGYLGLDGKIRIGITYPIINIKTGEYLGLVGAAVPTVPFFSNYGNIHDIKSQYLAVLDRNSVQLIHPVKEFIGKPFFGTLTQEATGYNEALNNLIKRVMDGKPSFAVYDFKNGQRLNTGSPVLIQGKPVYSVFVITPTATIYSLIDRVLLTQRIETFTLLAGVTVAVAVLIIFLVKWNSSLHYEVKRRTKQLNQANEELKTHDKMQREFINIAAHELRTPIQPILGLADVLRSKIHNNEQLEYLDVIIRNAKRLLHLAEDILDVSRIESQSLELHNVERFNIKDVISRNLQDYRNQIEKQGKKENIKLVYDDPKDFFVDADKARVSQVISNLLNNAIKFTQEGVVSISTERKVDNNIVFVKVQDTGQGIDPEILPRLFSKFVSKSFEGTGLGLYISKSIVEAHGGKIWGENNRDGKGATFYFSLPLSK